MERLSIHITTREADDGRDEHVVSVAARLFMRDGLANVKMVDIAEAAGIGVATLYRHFSTKANVAVAAATLLWRQLNEQLRQTVTSDEFVGRNGIGRLRTLLDAYCDAYLINDGFVRFLDEFDHMALAGQVSADELATYGSEVDALYDIFRDAYELGRTDCSIYRDVEFLPFYRALAHALIGVAQKFGRGNVIPSDDSARGREELACLVDMALWSLERPALAGAGRDEEVSD